MHALDVQRQPAGGQVAAEAADQLVVAAAAAEREANGRVVDLEHRARVVAELADEADLPAGLPVLPGGEPGPPGAEPELPFDDLPIVLTLAAHAGAPPEAIAQLRSQGLGWTEVASRIGLTADVLYVPEMLEELTPAIAILPLQLLAYEVAVARGTDVDQPRNLAKSVTVE